MTKFCVIASVFEGVKNLIPGVEMYICAEYSTKEKAMECLDMDILKERLCLIVEVETSKEAMDHILKLGN